MQDTTDEIGNSLRGARERQGLTLPGISSRTKIPVRSLEAIERNRFDELPGGVFRRAFVRTFAAEVGLDSDRVVRDYVERFEPASLEIQPPPSLATPDGRLRRLSGGALLLMAIVALLSWVLNA